MRVSGKIDFLPPELIQAPALWCVYGYKCFPHICCCKVNDTSYGQVIWGFSIYKRKPGFRTLGLSVREWSGQHEMCEFFTDHSEALEYIKKLTTPLHLLNPKDN